MISAFNSADAAPKCCSLWLGDIQIRSLKAYEESRRGFRHACVENRRPSGADMPGATTLRVSSHGRAALALRFTAGSFAALHNSTPCPLIPELRHNTRQDYHISNLFFLFPFKKIGPFLKKGNRFSFLLNESQPTPPLAMSTDWFGRRAPERARVQVHAFETVLSRQQSRCDRGGASVGGGVGSEKGPLGVET